MSTTYFRSDGCLSLLINDNIIMNNITLINNTFFPTTYFSLSTLVSTANSKNINISELFCANNAVSFWCLALYETYNVKIYNNTYTNNYGYHSACFATMSSNVQVLNSKFSNNKSISRCSFSFSKLRILIYITYPLLTTQQTKVVLFILQTLRDSYIWFFLFQ